MSDTDAARIGDVKAGFAAAKADIIERVLPSPVELGADVTGVALSTTALSTFANDRGYLYVPPGTFRVGTATITAPVVFAPGAAIAVDSGATFTILGAIDSPRQHIFQGAGNVVLGDNGTTGEAARSVHASWFGAFPGPATIGGVNNDQAPAISKAFAAVGNLRESIVEFDIGNYQLYTGVTVPRCCHVKGAGTRRTVFLCNTDGFIPFTTGGEGARITGVQFEKPTGPGTERVSPYIRLVHPNCGIDDVNAGRAFRSIEVATSGCKVSNVGGFFDAPGSAGSSLVAVSGANNDIRGILVANSSEFGPESIVHIGANTNSGQTFTSNISVSDILGSLPSCPVLIDAGITSVQDITINNVKHAPLNASKGITCRTSGAFNIDGVTVNGYNAGANVTPAVSVEQNSTGTMQDLTFSSVDFAASGGVGFSLVRTAGTARDIKIASSCNINERTTPISVSGAVAFIVDPGAMPNTKPSYCYDYTIADNGFVEIPLSRSVFTGFIAVTVGVSDFLLALPRAAGSPSLLTVQASANIQTTTGALNGTTGTNGKFVVSVTDGSIWLENRRGGSQRVNLILMTGV